MTRMANEDQLELLAEKIVRKTLLAVGIDIHTPEGVMAFQQDMHFLRDNRIRSKNLEDKTLTQIVTVIVSGLFAAAVLGAASFFQTPWRVQ